MRVYLDANVLFSAAQQGGVTDQLLERLCAVRAVEIVACPVAVGEAQRNLARKRPQWLEHFQVWAGRLTSVDAIVFPLPVELAHKDRPILCAAIRAKCDLLATGDLKDFGHLYDQTIRGVRVVSMLGLARWVKENEQQR